jgi:hypothetical protein
MWTSLPLATRRVLHTFVTEIPGVGTHTGVLVESFRHAAVTVPLLFDIVDAPLALDVAAVALAVFESPLLVEVKVVAELGGQSAEGQFNGVPWFRVGQT